MKKFSDFIKKSAEPQKKEPASNVIKGRFKIAKSDDDKHLAFGWANVAIRADGEEIEDWQEDIIEPEELENAAYQYVLLYREGGEMHERVRRVYQQQKHHSVIRRGTAKVSFLIYKSCGKEEAKWQQS